MMLSAAMYVRTPCGHLICASSTQRTPRQVDNSFRAYHLVVSPNAAIPFARAVSLIGLTQPVRTTARLAPVACPPILAPPAGSPHAHPSRISLSSVSFVLQRSLVESQVHGDRKHHHRHQCHQRVGVAGHAISLLVRLTSSSGDRFTLFYISRIWMRYCLKC